MYLISVYQKNQNCSKISEKNKFPEKIFSDFFIFSEILEQF
jgi:hypothetical protein